METFDRRRYILGTVLRRGPQYAAVGQSRWYDLQYGTVRVSFWKTS